DPAPRRLLPPPLRPAVRAAPAAALGAHHAALHGVPVAGEHPRAGERHQAHRRPAERVVGRRRAGRRGPPPGAACRGAGAGAGDRRGGAARPARDRPARGGRGRARGAAARAGTRAVEPHGGGAPPQGELQDAPPQGGGVRGRRGRRELRGMTRSTGATAVRWGIALGWLAVVLSLSGEPFNAHHTVGAVRSLLAWLGVPVSGAEARSLNVRIRTTAHVVEYALLAGLWLHAWRPPRGDHGRAALVVLALCLACAVVDETHQRWVPTRKGHAQDVGLDGTGALLGI